MSTINLKTSFQRVACIDANKYLTKSVRYSKIGQEDLIKYASENSGLSKAQMSAAFYAITQQIEQFVLNGHSLELGNLGMFYLSTRAKAGDTEQDAGADAVTGMSIRFRQSKRMRNYLLSNVSFVTLKDGDGEEENSTGGGTNSNPDDDTENGDHDLGENPLG